MSTALSNAFVTEATVAVAAAGLDFSAQTIKPAGFIHTGGGVLTWTDTAGNSHSLTADAGRAYPTPYPIASVTACTGSGSVQFFPAIAAGPAAYSASTLASATQTGVVLLSDAPADPAVPTALGSNSPKFAEIGSTSDPTALSQADDTHYGIAKLSVAAASAHKPIAVGSNDTRVCTVQRVLNFAAADGTFAESSVWIPGVACTITGVTLSMPGNVTKSDTDYLTYTLGIRDGAGGAASTVASKTTQVTGGGTFLAFQALSLGSLTNTAATATSQVTFKSVKTNSGQAVSGDSLLRITYTVP